MRAGLLLVAGLTIGAVAMFVGQNFELRPRGATSEIAPAPGRLPDLANVAEMPRATAATSPDIRPVSGQAGAAVPQLALPAPAVNAATTPAVTGAASMVVAQPAPPPTLTINAVIDTRPGDLSLVVSQAGSAFPLRSGNFAVDYAGTSEAGVPPSKVAAELKREDDARDFTSTISDAKNLKWPDQRLTVSGLPSGTYKLTLTGTLADGTKTPATVTVTVKVPGNDGVPPIVTQAANGPFAALASPAALELFGTAPYVRIAGQVAPAGGRLHFSVVAGSDRLSTGKVVAEQVMAIPAGNGDWDFAFKLPENVIPANSTGEIGVSAETKDGKFSYAASNIKFTVRPFDSPAKPGVDKLVVATPKGVAVAAVPGNPNSYRLNVGDFKLTVPNSTLTNHQQFVVFVDDTPKPQFLAAGATGGTSMSGVVRGLTPGTHTLTLAITQGDRTLVAADPITVFITTRGPQVKAVAPPNFGTAPGVQSLTVQFSPENPIDPTVLLAVGNYKLRPSGGTGGFDRGDAPLTLQVAGATPPAGVGTIELGVDPNSVVLTFPTLKPDVYRLEIKAAAVEQPTTPDNKPATDPGIRDLFGNALEGTPGTPGTNFFLVLSKPAAVADETAGLTSTTTGVTLKTGEYVAFPEYTRFRQVQEGFNPSDRVESRVVRLYYYRDAHRVAQIVNRKVKSYNRATVDVRRRAADKTRDEAGVATDERRRQEQRAAQAANDTRAVEKALQRAQEQLEAAKQQAARATDDANRLQAALPTLTGTQKDNATQQLQGAQAAVVSANAAANAAAAQVPALAADLQVKRAAEIRESELARDKQANEDRLKQDQFRAEVAAAREDPDTYAPGLPTSDDPVEQVSVSVIGEGVIQLRGPIKGLNVIRTMINQIDVPVGQVRIGIHTVQVNGEHGDRMEPVVQCIQREIDHARFMTAQSGQMLRKAVVAVASRIAYEAAAQFPGCSQADRDRRYLYGFFGQDFTDELRALDSEFLRTGNKLLSLHSMDSTSLASALFLMALAKNSVRMEIMQEFDRQLECELPVAEQSYYAAVIGCPPKHSKDKTGKHCDTCPPSSLSCSARFPSLHGYFDSNVQGTETMSPIQREFVKLAQIFKRRLITEIELKQRVVERSLLEDRSGTKYLEQLSAARKAEDDALQELGEVRKKFGQQRTRALQLITTLTGLTATLHKDLAFEANVDVTGPILKEQTAVAKVLKKGNDSPQFRRQASAINASNKLNDRLGATVSDFDISKYNEFLARARKIQGNMTRFNYGDDQSDFEEASQTLAQLTELTQPPAVRSDDFKQTLSDLISVVAVFRRVADNCQAELSDLLADSQPLVALLSQQDSDLGTVYGRWLPLRLRAEELIRRKIKDDATRAKLTTELDDADSSLRQLVELSLSQQQALQNAREKRRPLDHKKMLDMLVDDVEDKFIDLLEGTRSHTAIVDSYIKNLATALEDDFNAQFYNPTFRALRNASRTYDVSLGKVETTTVLTNNRSFAKVDPQATLEFDLPKRDILIKEAMASAKALSDTYGALVTDPSFLSLAKLGSGSPVASQHSGTSTGGAALRNVLPGLPTSPDEILLAQQGPGRRELGSQLEALIPEPAIYKFESGSGFEVRPVIAPDGQSVVFNFQYMYTTDIREPVRANEKHLARVKRHFVHTDVQTGNYELREVSKFMVALKAARTARGVPLLEDLPGVGALFRPLPSDESALQENIILAQSTIFPTLFDLMGLRYAQAVADVDPLTDVNAEFVVRERQRDVSNRVFDVSSSKVDDALRIPPGERRTDLYRNYVTTPSVHPNGFDGAGLKQRDAYLREGYDPRQFAPESKFVPNRSADGVPAGQPMSPYGPPPGYAVPPAGVPYPPFQQDSRFVPPGGPTGPAMPPQAYAIQPLPPGAVPVPPASAGNLPYQKGPALDAIPNATVAADPAGQTIVRRVPTPATPASRPATPPAAAKPVPPPPPPPAPAKPWYWPFGSQRSPGS